MTIRSCLELENGVKVDDLTFYGGKCDDFIDVWDIMADKTFFFSDFDEVETKEDFKKYSDEVVYDCCVARKNGKIVYASWIVISGWKSFYHCGLADKQFNDINLTKKLSNLAFDYYNGKYEINRFDALVLAKNRLSRLVTLRLGFKCLGRIPKYLLVNGIDEDYYQYYLEV